MRRIGLLEKKEGLATSRGLDSEKMDPYSVFLSLLDSDPEIFVAREENAFRHRPVAGQCEHVRDNQGIDTFLLSRRIHDPETNLHIRLICKRNVLWGGALRSAVIPVDSEQREPGRSLRKALQRGTQSLVVKIDVPACQPCAT